MCNIKGKQVLLCSLLYHSGKEVLCFFVFVSLLLLSVQQIAVHLNNYLCQ